MVCILSALPIPPLNMTRKKCTCCPHPPPIDHVCPTLLSIIRDAIVRIMLAGRPPQSEPQMPSPFHGHDEDRRQEENEVPQALAGSGKTEGKWRAVLPGGDRTLPSDASTCILWCAIALGALVRGCPLAIVRVLLHIVFLVSFDT